MVLGGIIYKKQPGKKIGMKWLMEFSGVVYIYQEKSFYRGW
jgi:hypothetical protein